MPSSESLVSRFIAAMSEQYAVYESLLRLSSLKRDAVTGGSLAELDKIIREEQALLSKNAKYENLRQTCAGELSQSTSVPLKDITFASFEEIATEEEKTAMAELRVKLMTVYEKLRAENSINSRLIGSRLEFVQSMMSSGLRRTVPSAYNSRGSSITPESDAFIYERKV